MSRSLPLLLVALLCLAGCPVEEPDDDVTGDDDTADDDTGDDDTGDDDTADDDATGDDDTAAGAPDIVVNPPALILTACVGSPEPAVLNIANAGTADLHVTGVFSSVDELTLPPLPPAIAPGTHEQLNITAACTVEAAVTGSLVIESDDPDESPLAVPVDLTCEFC